MAKNEVSSQSDHFYDFKQQRTLTAQEIGDFDYHIERQIGRYLTGKPDLRARKKSVIWVVEWACDLYANKQARMDLP